MEIWTKTYSTQEVAGAADIAYATLQNWINRRAISLHPVTKFEGGGVQGKQRHFSFHAVVQIAIAAAIIKASGGMELKEAFEAATNFAALGHGVEGKFGHFVEDQAVREDGDFPRDPGHPFHFRHGKTLLATTNGRTAILLDRGHGDTFKKISFMLRGAVGFTVIDAGAVFDRVCSALGEEPKTVLDEAYGTGGNPAQGGAP